MNNEPPLTTDLCGIELSNPVLLASGVMGTTPGGLRRVARAGAGGVTTKSLGLEARSGHRSPNVVEVSGGYLNAMGLPNPGVEEFAAELDGEALAVPVFGSIYGANPGKFSRAAEILAPEVDGLELNLSCPHAERLGAATGSDPKLVREIVSEVTRTVDVPVFAKLTPNVAEIVRIGEAAQEGGADGVVAINTLKAMAIDVKIKRPILGNGSGGLSGPAIHPVAVKSVYDLYENLSVPIIGVGGVRSLEDLVELILAGATAVQVGTAVADRGLGIFRELPFALSEYLSANGTTVPELVGEAHREIPNSESR